MLYGLKEILKLYNVKALKNLSQNFIFDQNLLSNQMIHGFLYSTIRNLEKIVSVGSPPSAETAVIEIGPAAGNLTRALLGRGYDKILLIEKDLRFKPILEVNSFNIDFFSNFYFSNLKIMPMGKFNLSSVMHWNLMILGSLLHGQKMAITLLISK